MYKPEKFEIKHKYIDGQLIMYKLIYRNTKNSYMHINESDQTVEIIVSKYATPNMTEQFVDTYLKQMHENIMKLSNSKVVDKNYNYMCIFGKKYQIKVLISHNKKNYEIIGNTIYFKVKKTSDCNELVKLVYEDLTYGFIKKRFLFWSKEMGLTAELNFKAMTRCWGVCYHYKKKINLATRLGGRSKEAIDYVIVHELSHLQHPNHSKAFWFLVSQYISDWKKYRHYDTI